jgi:hypothetical protein
VAAIPIKPRRITAASKTRPIPADITKIDRMKTRKVDSMFLKLDVACNTVRMFGRPEEPGGAVGSERLLHPGERTRSPDGNRSLLPGEAESSFRQLSCA